MFFDFSSAFNTIQPSLLRVKLGVGVDCHLAAWTIDYLTNRPRYVRLQDCVSDVVVSSMGAPQGTQEVIVTLKTGKSLCLDPEEEFTKRLLQRTQM
uniref:Chemokine interleukin-8-like domain-containing protein n=1 Tax=Amphiprion percula TaxID=161767 RepID=A0A3P8RYE5_AMPPE